MCPERLHRPRPKKFGNLFYRNTSHLFELKHVLDLLTQIFCYSAYGKRMAVGRYLHEVQNREYLAKCHNEKEIVKEICACNVQLLYRSHQSYTFF